MGRGGSRIPTSVVAPVLRELMNGCAMAAVTFWTGVPERRLYAILHEEQEAVELATVDMLLSGFERNDLWRVPPLADYYLEEVA